MCRSLTNVHSASVRSRTTRWCSTVGDSATRRTPNASSRGRTVSGVCKYSVVVIPALLRTLRARYGAPTAFLSSPTLRDDDDAIVSSRKQQSSHAREETLPGLETRPTPYAAPAVDPSVRPGGPE